jgi:hypothetical protein
MKWRSEKPARRDRENALQLPQGGGGGVLEPEERPLTVSVTVQGEPVCVPFRKGAHLGPRCLLWRRHRALRAARDGDAYQLGELLDAAADAAAEAMEDRLVKVDAERWRAVVFVEPAAD